MNGTEKDTKNGRLTIHKKIRDYFRPVDKTYLHRVAFYLIYLAFLLIPMTAAFLGQFRTGAAFMAIFLGIALAMPWIRYFDFLGTIKKEWPSAKEQEELYEDFAGSADVFSGEAKVGRKYTFFRGERAIVPTDRIKEFRPLRARSGVVIRAILPDGYKTVTKIAYYKDMMPDLQKQLDEAADSLKM